MDMRRWIPVVLAVCLLTGCAGQSAPPSEESAETPQEDAVTLPGEYPKELVFASGAGAWGTALTLEADGSFTGSYGDSEMGDDRYPKGVHYTCAFAGRFTDLKQVDETTYAMTLNGVEILTKETEPWEEDGVGYIPSDPYGLETGTEFYFYTPEHPLEGLDEEFLSWWPDNWQREEQNLTTLGCWAIHNVETGYGFFTWGS